MSTMPDWVALLWLYAFLAAAGLIAGVFVLATLAEEREREETSAPQSVAGADGRVAMTGSVGVEVEPAPTFPSVGSLDPAERRAVMRVRSDQWAGAPSRVSPGPHPGGRVTLPKVSAPAGSTWGADQ